MCTLSVITRDNGYLLAMNRDEQIARGAGETPKTYSLDTTTVVYPSERMDGTWIAANTYGITLALLNRNNVAKPPLDRSRARSRGQIIPALAGSSCMAELKTGFGRLDLQRTPPFRLVGVFPLEMAIGEWRCDSVRLAPRAYQWRSRHWFSSSLSDGDAARERGTICRNARQESDAGSVPWLRRLHASHGGGPGPFSLCVHRKDVATLSYSEVIVTPVNLQMRHFRNSPCTMDQIPAIELLRVDCPDPYVWNVATLPV